MIKKTLLAIVILLLVVFTCVSCKKDPYGDLFTADEIKLLEAVKGDIQEIPEADYVSVVTELLAHTHEYEGRLFQLEGVYSEKYGHGETPCVYRSVKSEDGREMIYPMLLSGVSKEVEEGSWVRVIGILSSKADDHGHTNTVLDVLAIGILPKEGSPLIDAD